MSGPVTASITVQTVQDLLRPIPTHTNLTHTYTHATHTHQARTYTALTTRQTLHTNRHTPHTTDPPHTHTTPLHEDQTRATNTQHQTHTSTRTIHAPYTTQVLAFLGRCSKSVRGCLSAASLNSGSAARFAIASWGVLRATASARASFAGRSLFVWFLRNRLCYLCHLWPKDPVSCLACWLLLPTGSRVIINGPFIKSTPLFAKLGGNPCGARTVLRSFVAAPWKLWNIALLRVYTVLLLAGTEAFRWYTPCQ